MAESIKFVLLNNIIYSLKKADKRSPWIDGDVDDETEHRRF